MGIIGRYEGPNEGPESQAFEVGPEAAAYENGGLAAVATEQAELAHEQELSAVGGVVLGFPDFSSSHLRATGIGTFPSLPDNGVRSNFASSGKVGNGNFSTSVTLPKPTVFEYALPGVSASYLREKIE